MADIGLILPISHFNFSNVKFNNKQFIASFEVDQACIEDKIMKSKIGLSYVFFIFCLPSFVFISH